MAIWETVITIVVATATEAVMVSVMTRTGMMTSLWASVVAEAAAQVATCKTTKGRGYALPYNTIEP
jgi:hypothetical protein